MGAKEKKLTLISLVLMIFASVFGFPNMPKAFFLMGYAGVPFYIVCAILFFFPFAIMISEYGAAYRDEAGGMFSWLTDIRGSRYAFITTLLWYNSVIIWFVTTVSSIWIPLSNGLFGADLTGSLSLFGLDSVETIGVLGITFMVVVTIFASRGLNNVRRVATFGGIAIAVLNVILIVGSLIVAAVKGIQTPVNFAASPNPEYHSFASIASFATFALYAYTGLELLGSLVDKTENAQKIFPRGILMGTLAIAIGYSIGIICIGFSTNWNLVLNHETVNLGNIPYVIMENLGYQIASALGASQQVCLAAGSFTAHFVGVSMFFAIAGAFFTDAYSPLKSLILGAPENFWPGRLGQLKDGVPVVAMWAQAAISIFFIALVSFGGKNAAGFYEIINLMNNVSSTLPFILLAYPFVRFKKKQVKGKINGDFMIVRNVGLAKVMTVSICLCLAAADFFAIMEPIFNNGAAGIRDSFYMIIGPLVFSVIGLAMYANYQKRLKASKDVQ